ncbi:acyl-CoA N-acyltransferase [Endogone sp. FLAS-F59071]|nr:acyl-CoA N-acyltransferase [Endogone sp. FLAS-F59071]|eukprot:RUS19501.1 acyl-CoA N-acyltransferase [Endogone sp. FLAS-F59071]
MSTEHRAIPYDTTIIPVTSFHLSPLLPTDFPALVRYLNDPDVCANLLLTLYPYTMTHAEDFYKVERTLLWTDPLDENASPIRLNHVIRETRSGELVGEISIKQYSKDFLDESEKNRDIWTVGYWLAPEWWGKGVMTEVVKKVLEEVMIDRMGKREFRVGVFEGNWGSRKVLERSGFVFKKTKEAMYVKNGVSIDAWILEKVVNEN